MRSPKSPPPRCASWQQESKAGRQRQDWKTWSAISPCWRKSFSPHLLAATPDEEIVTVRAQADRELAPYRRKMAAAQIEQLQKQYIHKRLLEKYGLPRLSLFYM